MQNFVSKAKAGLSAVAGLALGLMASAITVSNGEVTFGASDNTAMNSAVSNSVSNLWAGFQFILPYVGIAVGILFVISMAKKLTKHR